MENTETKITNNEIDDALSLIDDAENKQIIEADDKKDIAVQEEKKEEKFSIDDLTEQVLKSVKDVNSKTDETYDLFYTPIALGKDRSDASKQSLMDSLRLKNEAMENIVGIINAKAKLIAAQNQQANRVGVIVQTKSGDDVGINLGNLK